VIHGADIFKEYFKDYQDQYAEPIEPRSMGLKGVTADEVAAALRSIYSL
jgi:hypothetical protein